MERYIRPLELKDLEAYLDIYLNSYPAYKALDEECRQHYREKHTYEIMNNKEVKTVGLFENDVLIATMKLVKFNMNLYGELHLAYGLMALEVHPLHKKKGAAFEMVKYFEEYAIENGALVTLLLPFKIAFYRKMGYGFGAKMDEYHIPTHSLPKAKSMEHLRFLELSETDKMLACHKNFVKKNHGMVDKFEEEIRGMDEDYQARRVGFFDGEELRGYVAYRFENASETNYTQNRISVEEMVYDSGEVLKELLGYLRLQEDLAQNVILRTGEEDFYHILDDPQDVSGYYINFGFLQSNKSAVGTMFKLVNPREFIKATSYRKLAAADSLVAEFCYYDEMNHKDESIKIVFEKGHWSLAEAEQGADVTVECSQGDFASLMLGSCQLAAMVRLGAVQVSDLKYVDVLNRLLYCDKKPWSNSDY